MCTLCCELPTVGTCFCSNLITFIFVKFDHFLSYEEAHFDRHGKKLYNKETSQ